MKFTVEIDTELTFTDESHNPYRLRNAVLIDGHVTDDPMDAVTAYANHARAEVTRFGEFGAGGGHAAKTYSRAVTGQLHHETQYCPCRILTADEYEDCKCHGL